MKKITLLFAIGLLVGCINPKNTLQQLNQAESQMSEHPDSAKQILESIPRQTLRTRKARARFALLYSQALDKNYIDVDQDSIAHLATNYYKNHGSVEEKALAYYYRGRVYENAQQVDSAIIIYDQAEKHIHQSDNYYLKGSITSALARMYSSQRYEEHSYTKYIEAAEYFESSNHNINALRSYIGALGLASFAHDYIKQEILLNHCDSISAGIENIDIKMYLARSRASLLINRDSDYNTALTILNNAIDQYSNHQIPTSYYIILSETFLHLNRLDSAIFYAKKLYNKYQGINLHYEKESQYLLGKILSAQNNYKEAYSYAAKALILSDSLYYIEKEQAIPELQERYKNQQLALQNLYLQAITQYQRYIAGIIILVLLFAILWIYKRRQQKLYLQEQKIMEYHETISRMKNDYERLQALYNNNQGSLSSSINKDKLDRNLAFLKQLFDITSTFMHDKDKLQAKIEDFLIKNGGNQELFVIFQDMIDMYYPGIIDYIKAKYPQINDKELTLYCMICLDISQSSACTLLSLQQKTYYNYRNLLRNKLGIANGNLRIPDHFQQICAEFQTRKL